MRERVNDLMARASERLVARDYAACETLCREALRLSREAGDWGYYHRILLPLQEACRQRRMIAADAGVRLGCSSIEPDGGRGLIDAPELAPLWERGGGCVVVTGPHGPVSAAGLRAGASEAGLNCRVLLADISSEATGCWRIVAFDDAGGTSGPACDRRPPLAVWRETWLTDQASAAGDTTGGPAAARAGLRATGSATPMDWFLDAGEALGDAGIAQIAAPSGSLERLAALEALLPYVPDHEKLYQRLAEAARALIGQRPD